MLWKMLSVPNSSSSKQKLYFYLCFDGVKTVQHSKAITISFSLSTSSIPWSRASSIITLKSITITNSWMMIIIQVLITPFCALYDMSGTSCLYQGCKWHYKKFSENAGVQGPHRPCGVKGQHPCGGPKGATPLGRNWIFTLLQLKNWPLSDRSWLKSDGKRKLIREKYKYITYFFAG